MKQAADSFFYFELQRLAIKSRLQNVCRAGGLDEKARIKTPRKKLKSTLEIAEIKKKEIRRSKALFIFTTRRGALSVSFFSTSGARFVSHPAEHWR